MKSSSRNRSVLVSYEGLELGSKGDKQVKVGKGLIEQPWSLPKVLQKETVFSKELMESLADMTWLKGGKARCQVFGTRCAVSFVPLWYWLILPGGGLERVKGWKG